MYDESYNYYITNNLLSDLQHGFRKKKCTTSNLLELNDLKKFLDGGNNVDLITIDFSKLLIKYRIKNYYISYLIFV